MNDIKKKRGFSLNELLIVMGIMATLAVIGIPTYLSARNRYVIDGETDKMIALFREGIDKAKSQQGGVVWGIGVNNGTSDWYELLEGGVGGTSTSRVYLDSMVSFTATTTSTSTNISGGPSINILGSNFTVGITTANGQFADIIVIDTLGRISRTSNYE